MKHDKSSCKIIYNWQSSQDTPRLYISNFPKDGLPLHDVGEFISALVAMHEEAHVNFQNLLITTCNEMSEDTDLTMQTESIN